MSVVDRTKLNALKGNLVVGQFADPNLQRDVFEEIYTNLDIRPENTEVLTKNNATPYTPSQPYHPATKKYIDEALLDIVVGTLPEGSINTTYLADEAVTYAKLAAPNKLAFIGGTVYTYKNMGGF